MIKRQLCFTIVLMSAVSVCTRESHAQQPTAMEVVRKAIDASGGEQALNRLKSPMMWMDRGTFHGMGDGVPFVGQYVARYPDWYRQEIEGAFAITVSGDDAWVTTADGNVQTLSGVQLEEQLQQVRGHWAQRLFPLVQDKAYKLSLIEGKEINERPTVGVKASHPKHRDIKFYFDRENHLLLKTEAMVVSPQSGPDPVLSEVYFSDHKSFSGIRMPAKMKAHHQGELFVEGETIDYKMSATLDPSQFQP